MSGSSFLHVCGMGLPATPQSERSKIALLDGFWVEIFKRLRLGASRAISVHQARVCGRMIYSNVDRWLINPLLQKDITVAVDIL